LVQLLIKWYGIVTKDSDFNELSVVFGFPPKVIWLRRGNCTTRDIEALKLEQILLL
jgi:predicted nuclease of predicted toxin-antitoxin system